MRTQSIKRQLVFGGAVLGLGLAGATAAPLQVILQETRYSTYLFVATNAGWTEGITSANQSPTPRSDALAVTFPDPQAPDNFGSLGADASATTFGVSVHSYYQLGPVFFPARNATARAESVARFTPLTTGLTTLTLNLHGAQEWFYSEGAVSLLDHTANQTLWDYQWSFTSFIPGAERTANPDGSVDFAHTLETFFDATHSYTLTLREQSWADCDQQQISVQLNGLDVVSVAPEPSALALIGLGAVIGLGSRRWALRNQARQ